MLKWIGLKGLIGEDSLVRHNEKRRRGKTVIQELIYIRAHTYKRGGRLAFVSVGQPVHFFFSESL